MADGVHIVVVQVGPHRCGLLADDVEEVLHAVRIAALPGAPAAVEGVIDLRGVVVPVLDVRQRFGLERRPVTPRDRLVVMRAGERGIALRVDHALDLVVASTDDLEQAPAVVSSRGDTTGLVRLPDGLVVICDPATFLSGEEAIVLEELLAAADNGAA